MTECALLFTDIEGSTALWELEPASMRVGLQLHDDIMREAIGKNGGTVFSMAGDSFAAWFIAVEEAVLCAVEAQAVLTTTQWPTTRPIAARMGIHVGAASDPEHLTGPATNRAARVMSAGHVDRFSFPEPLSNASTLASSARESPSSASASTN